METDVARKRPGDRRARPKAKPKPEPKPKPKPKQRETARLRKVREMFPTTRLMRICKVTRQAINAWHDVPPKHAIALERASKGALTKEYLAPNFYPATAH